MPTPDIRTAPGKKKFVNALCNRIRDVTIERVEAMPPDWDGIELRLYLAQLFADEIHPEIRRGKRRRDYENTKAIKNL